MKFKQTIPVTAMALSALLIGCGGGGSGSSNKGQGGGYSTPEPEKPLVIPSATLKTTSTIMGDTFTAAGQVAVLRSNNSQLSVEVITSSELSLYTFDKDEVDFSACIDDSCITTWPPLLANKEDKPTAPLGIFEREDGFSQWTLNGLPLYFFKGDEKSGDVNGEGIKGVWDTALVQPVEYQSDDVQGEYLGASGRVLTTTSIGEAFSPQQQNKLDYALYTFSKDEEGKSNCNDVCLKNWPALLAEEGDKAVAPYSIIERKLGSNGETAKQWALNGYPLYFYVGDNTKDDLNGILISDWYLARPPVAKLVNSSRGSYLAASGLALQAKPNSQNLEVTSKLALDNFSLYTYDLDEQNKTNCYGTCLTNWPALIAPKGAEPYGPYTLVTRESGEKQWAINGSPLYFYREDIKPGDELGDEVGGVWHLARPVPVVTATKYKQVMLAGHGQLVDMLGKPDSIWEDFTLYTFDKDQASGKSACFGDCAVIWPPLFAESDAVGFGDFTVIQRDDPSTDNVEEVFQWAYKNEPLYFYNKDFSKDDVNGDGVKGVWHIALP